MSPNFVWTFGQWQSNASSSHSWSCTQYLAGDDNTASERQQGSSNDVKLSASYVTSHSCPLPVINLKLIRLDLSISLVFKYGWNISLLTDYALSRAAAQWAMGRRRRGDYLHPHEVLLETDLAVSVTGSGGADTQVTGATQYWYW